jgi:hypothetical protein
VSNIFPTKPSHLERVERELKKMENDLLRESTAVVYSAVTHTFDLDPTSPEMPAAWMEELEDCSTEQEAQAKRVELDKRKRIAQYALMSPKEAPVALQIAAKVLSGMQKAKAMEGAGPKHLNLTMVSISAPNQPVPLFPEKEIKHE